MKNEKRIMVEKTEAAQISKRIAHILDEKLETESVDRILLSNIVSYKKAKYVNCIALSVDMRDSVKLAVRYNSNTEIQAKIFKAYISEAVRIMQSSSLLWNGEVSMNGDKILGVYHSQNLLSDSVEVLSLAKKLYTLLHILNDKFFSHHIDEIKIGIGISYGKALMIKVAMPETAQETTQETMEEKNVWIGEVIDESLSLSKHANKGINEILMVSNLFYNYLAYNAADRSQLRHNAAYDCYHGHVYDEDLWSDFLKTKVKKTASITNNLLNHPKNISQNFGENYPCVDTDSEPKLFIKSKQKVPS